MYQASAVSNASDEREMTANMTDAEEEDRVTYANSIDGSIAALSRGKHFSGHS